MLKAGPVVQGLGFRRYFFLSIITLLALLSWSQAASAFWPISWKLGDETNYFGPLVTIEREHDRDVTRAFTVRPFLFSYEPGKETVSFLYPFGKATSEKSYFIPFSTSKYSGEESDSSLLFFFQGKTKERSYGGFFPLYGKLYKRFGREEMGFFLWPLYGYTEDQGGRKTDILWPFFSIYTGNQHGFKFWPLFGTRNIRDERVTGFFLWPFFIWERKALDTDEPKNSFFAIPFFIKTTSPNSAYYSVLPPFFVYSRSPDKRRISAPWPIFTRTTGKEQEGLSFFPFYQYEKRENIQFTYILWPVVKNTTWSVGEKQNFESRILLINRYTDDNRGTFLNVWPFFEYRKQADKKAFFFPSPLPFRYEEMDRIIKPLFTLYTYREKDGMRLSNFLYGLYTKEERDDSWKRRFAFLFELSKEKEGVGFEVLSGLFSVSQKQVKLFYIPIKRAAGERVDPASE